MTCHECHDVTLVTWRCGDVDEGGVVMVITLSGRGGRGTLGARGGDGGGAGQRGQRPGELQQVVSGLGLLLGPGHHRAEAGGGWGNIWGHRDVMI